MRWLQPEGRLTVGFGFHLNRAPQPPRDWAVGPGRCLTGRRVVGLIGAAVAVLLAYGTSGTSADTSLLGIAASVAKSGLALFALEFICQLVVGPRGAPGRAFWRVCECGAMLLVAGSALLMAEFDDCGADFWPEPGGDSVQAPQSVDAAEPLPQPERWPGPADTFQTGIRASAHDLITGTPTVDPRLPSLRELANHHPALLRRYLATSPAWRLNYQFAHDTAARRWKIGTHWRWEDYGRYAFAVDGADEGWTLRTQIGLDGRAPMDGGCYRPWAAEGAARSEIWTWPGDKGIYQSAVAVLCGAAVVGVEEAGPATVRPATRAALWILEHEFRDLLRHGAVDESVLPADATHRGEPVLELYRSRQPGVYNLEAWVNPGEAGRVYLKVFDLCTGMPYLAEWLRGETNEATGWSSDPEELFLASSEITMSDGTSYCASCPVRFMLVFEPDSGGPARKLLDRVFRVERG